MRLARCLFATFVALPFSSPALGQPFRAYVDTPSLCHRVDKVEGTRVDLLSSSGACLPGGGKALVEFPERVTEVDVYVDGVFWKRQAPSSYGAEAVLRLMEDTASRAKEMVLPENVYAEQGRQAAEAVAGFFASPEQQARLQAEQNRLRDVVVPPESRRAYQDLSAATATSTPPSAGDTGRRLLGSGERVYVFVSKSVPLATLRAYAEALDALNDPNVVMVLRGMVGGMTYIGPTMRFLRSILVTDPGCEEQLRSGCASRRASIVVDPLLFRRYGIKQVPAIVYARDVARPDGDYGSEGLPKKTTVGSSFAVEGDVGLDYALETIEKDAKSASLPKVVATLRASFHNPAPP